MLTPLQNMRRKTSLTQVPKRPNCLLEANNNELGQNGEFKQILLLHYNN